MRGARVKFLRNGMRDSGIALMPKGWRKLKCAWKGTPVPDRPAFSAAEACRALKSDDVRRWVKRLTVRQREVLGEVVAHRKAGEPIPEDLKAEYRAAFPRPTRRRRGLTTGIAALLGLTAEAFMPWRWGRHLRDRRRW